MATGAPAYKVEDRSILLPFYRRFFVDPLLPYLPAKLNPNTITHVGHLLNLLGAAFLLVMWPKRGWPFVAAMITLQLYTWCDNADGAHARRTNQCSPLGEFLDHGLDSLNTVYIGFLTCMALGVSPHWWVVIALVIPGAGVLTYWEQTQTGTFRLGLLNQLESVTVLSTVLAGSAIFGSDIWEKVTILGFPLQRGILMFTAGAILFGMARGMQRVAVRDGIAAILPALVIIAFGVAIAEAAAVSAIGTIPAVTLATCANVHFCSRMLTLRLHKRLPRVDTVVLAFTAALVGMIVWTHLGHEPSPLWGMALSTLACAIFGGQAIFDTRSSIQQIQRLPAR